MKLYLELTEEKDGESYMLVLNTIKEALDKKGLVIDNGCKSHANGRLLYFGEIIKKES